jgi:excisionase family DNA binding protein
VTLLGILVACIMFAVLVRVLVQTYGERPPEKPRIAIDPESEYWLTTAEVAVLLETAEDDVMNLVERGGIPFYAVAGGNRSNPDTYRFDRVEIDDWVIG